MVAGRPDHPACAPGGWVSWLCLSALRAFPPVDCRRGPGCPGLAFTAVILNPTERQVAASGDSACLRGIRGVGRINCT